MMPYGKRPSLTAARGSIFTARAAKMSDLIPRYGGQKAVEPMAVLDCAARFRRNSDTVPVVALRPCPTIDGCQQGHIFASGDQPRCSCCKPFTGDLVFVPDAVPVPHRAEHARKFGLPLQFLSLGRVSVEGPKGKADGSGLGDGLAYASG